MTEEGLWTAVIIIFFVLLLIAIIYLYTSNYSVIEVW